MGSPADEHDDDDPDDAPDDDPDDEPDDLEHESSGAPPDPLDRVWRHPTELPPVPRARRVRPSLMPLLRPLVAGVAGALVAVAVLAAIGAFDDDDEPDAILADPRGSAEAEGADPLGDGAAAGTVLVTVRDETGARRVSGVCVRHGGEVLTSASALGTATAAQVTTADGQTYDATLAGRDDATDLVLLTVSSPVPAVPVAETKPRVGDDTWILTGPMPGTNQAWRSSGVVAATDAFVASDPGPTFSGLLETDASGSPASAGGALLNEAGEVTGIVLSPVAGRQTTVAIPIAIAIGIANDLRDDGVAAHGALGLVGVDSADGPVVTEVSSDSAAARAGILPGDIVAAIADRPVLDMGELTAMVRRYGPGKVVTLSVVRQGEAVNIDVHLSSTAPEALAVTPMS